MVFVVALGVIGLVVVAGCGGGGSSSSSSGDAGGGGSSRIRQRRRRGLHQCRQADRGARTPQQEQVLEYIERTETVIEELDEEVAALGGSGSAEAAYAEALGKAVNVLNQMTNAARNENFDAVREISDELVELNLGELAEAAELKACAEVPVSA